MTNWGKFWPGSPLHSRVPQWLNLHSETMEIMLRTAQPVKTGYLKPGKVKLTAIYPAKRPHYQGKENTKPRFKSELLRRKGNPEKREDRQGVPTQYIKILRELYKDFTTKVSLFYNDINIDVKRGVRQGGSISPKLFTATLQNVMQTLEWDNMGMKIDDWQLRHLHFADDIALITPNIGQA
ncbi:unnamed protein product [Angiostrongylus costaricensis]|uniref:Reverse transcriptase domain-containing protein n=1 Tax=Angiostrongylus costaricensis TaxID=334426 RepID=A0A0R3PEW4_ANGCS|nr:unnamed protein product [Angiostrongylus costaricensis]